MLHQQFARGMLSQKKKETDYEGCWAAGTGQPSPGVLDALLRTGSQDALSHSRARHSALTRRDSRRSTVTQGQSSCCSAGTGVR